MKNIKKYNKNYTNLEKMILDFVMNVLRAILSFVFSFFFFWYCLFFGPVGWIVIGAVAYRSYHTIFKPFDLNG